MKPRSILLAGMAIGFLISTVNAVDYGQRKRDRKKDGIWNWKHQQEQKR